MLTRILHRVLAIMLFTSFVLGTLKADSMMVKCWKASTKLRATKASNMPRLSPATQTSAVLWCQRIHRLSCC
jgi:hypothetical protein